MLHSCTSLPPFVDLIFCGHTLGTDVRAAARRQFNGSRAAPALLTPKSISKYLVVFVARNATRTPGVMSKSSTLAIRLDRAAAGDDDDVVTKQVAMVDRVV